VSPQFFFILALQQVWTIGVDFILKHGYTTGSGFNTATAALALVMASSQRNWLHSVGTGVAWALFLSAFFLRGLRIVD
jgi:hypothetical protein